MVRSKVGLTFPYFRLVDAFIPLIIIMPIGPLIFFYIKSSPSTRVSDLLKRSHPFFPRPHRPGSPNNGHCFFPGHHYPGHQEQSWSWGHRNLYPAGPLGRRGRNTVDAAVSGDDPQPTRRCGRRIWPPASGWTCRGSSAGCASSRDSA